MLGDGKILDIRSIIDNTIFPISLESFVGSKEIELLTLSACNTGLVRKNKSGVEGESFAGFFLDKTDVKSVLMTKWAVADESTSILMQEFYKSWGKEGLSKIEALQKAQLSLIKGDIKTLGATKTYQRKQKRSEIIRLDGSKMKGKPFAFNPNAPFSHPFYWSPFVLIGNWR